MVRSRPLKCREIKKMVASVRRARLCRFRNDFSISYHAKRQGESGFLDISIPYHHPLNISGMS